MQDDKEKNSQNFQDISEEPCASEECSGEKETVTEKETAEPVQEKAE